MAKDEKDAEQVKQEKPTKKQQAAEDRQKRIESVRKLAKGEW